MTSRRRGTTASKRRPRAAGTALRRGTAPSSRRPPRKAAATRRRETARRPTRARRPPGRLRRLVRRRPFSAVLLLVIGLLMVLAWGPLQSYSAAAARVEALQATHDRLEQEVARLAQRRAALQDPEEIELLARRQHGLVRPGEVPFIVVTEEPQPQVEDPAVVQDVDGDAWWRDLVERAVELLP